MKEWFWAARPKTLSTAVVPFLSGTFLAFAEGAAIEWLLMIFAWLSAICIQIGTNFTNDAYDFRRGADHANVLGPQRFTRAGMLSGMLSFNQVRTAGVCCFAAAFFFGSPLIYHGGGVVFVILLLSVLSGFLYTGGPYPLAYHGLGDVFVFLFYGGIATNAAYWLQTGTISLHSILLSLQIGCLCTSMIAINNLRDVYDDAKAAKNTLPVRFGVLFGKAEVAAMLFLPLLTNLLWPWALVVWIPFVSAPLALIISTNIWRGEPSDAYNKYLALSGVNMMLFCLLQVAGLILT